MTSLDRQTLVARLEAVEQELRRRREAGRRRVFLLHRLRVLCTISAISAIALWAAAQGIEFKTSDGTSEVQRFKIEPGTGVGVDTKAYFVGSNLGIGTSNPLYRVHLLRTTDPCMLLVDAVGAVGPNYVGRRANGVPGALTPVASGDNLAVFGALGYGATGYSASYRGAIRMVGTQAWTDAAQGGAVAVSSTTNGSTTLTERLRVDHDGEVGIGDYSATEPDALLDVRKPVANALGPVLRLTGGGGAGAQTALDLATYNPAGQAPGARIVATDDGAFGAHLDFLIKLPGANANALQNRMRLTNAGLVGIGTTNPQTRLHVVGGGANSLAGNASATGVLIDEDAGGQPRIELRGVGEQPYIDYANDGAADFDCRFILDGDDRLTLNGGRLRVSSGNWAGLWLDNTAGRDITLENNSGLGGGGGLRIWDQTGGGLIADLATDNTWTIEQGGTIKWSGSTGTNLLDFNKGASSIREDAQLRFRSDDYIYIENSAGGNLTAIYLNANLVRTTGDFTCAGGIGANGGGGGYAFHGIQAGGTVAVLDRDGTDGAVTALRQDGVTEGSMSISGGTTSYNGFTGSHYGHAAEGRTFEKWSLLVLTGRNRTTYGREFGRGETIYGVETTDVPDDPRVLGVFLDVDREHADQPLLVAAVGDGFLLVTDTGGDIAIGDFLASSERPGYGRRQAAEAATRATVAKAQQPVDWSKVPVDPAKGFKWKKIAVTYRAG